MPKQIPSSQDGCSDTPEGGKCHRQKRRQLLFTQPDSQRHCSQQQQWRQCKKTAALEETRLENKGYPFPHVRSPARETKRTLLLRPTVLKPWVSIGLGFVLFCFVFDGEKKRKVGCFFCTSLAQWKQRLQTKDKHV